MKTGTERVAELVQTETDSSFEESEKRITKRNKWKEICMEICMEELPDCAYTVNKH